MTQNQHVGASIKPESKFLVDRKHRTKTSIVYISSYPQMLLNLSLNMPRPGRPLILHLELGTSRSRTAT